MNVFHYIIFYSILFAGNFKLIAQSRIQDLTATQYKQQVLINYRITPGNACTGYQVQRSADSVNFELLHDYSGVCGDMVKSQHVSFTDIAPVKNTINYYRILIPPADYSAITSVNYLDVSEQGYVLFGNPVTQNLVITGKFEKAVLKLIDSSGNLIKEIESDEKGGYNGNTSDLSAGLYYFIIEDKDTGQKISGKFVKE